MESALERELRAARRDRARDETTTISSGALRPGVGAPSITSSSAPGGTAHYTTQGGSFFEIPHSQQHVRAPRTRVSGMRSTVRIQARCELS